MGQCCTTNNVEKQNFDGFLLNKGCSIQIIQAILRKILTRRKIKREATHASNQKGKQISQNAQVQVTSIIRK